MLSYCRIDKDVNWFLIKPNVLVVVHDMNKGEIRTNLL